MKAYVELIQRKEADIGCDVLTHQKVCCTANALRTSRNSFCSDLFSDCLGAMLIKSSGPERTMPTP
jgi:hypothetical protein